MVTPPRKLPPQKKRSWNIPMGNNNNSNGSNNNKGAPHSLNNRNRNTFSAPSGQNMMNRQQGGIRQQQQQQQHQTGNVVTPQRPKTTRYVQKLPPQRRRSPLAKVAAAASTSVSGNAQRGQAQNQRANIHASPKSIPAPFVRKLPPQRRRTLKPASSVSTASHTVNSPLSGTHGTTPQRYRVPYVPKLPRQKRRSLKPEQPQAVQQSIQSNEVLSDLEDWDTPSEAELERMEREAAMEQPVSTPTASPATKNLTPSSRNTLDSTQKVSKNPFSSFLPSLPPNPNVQTHNTMLKKRKRARSEALISPQHKKQRRIQPVDHVSLDRQVPASPLRAPRPVTVHVVSEEQFQDIANQLSEDSTKEVGISYKNTKIPSAAIFLQKDDTSTLWCFSQCVSMEYFSRLVSMLLKQQKRIITLNLIDFFTFLCREDIGISLQLLYECTRSSNEVPFGDPSLLLEHTSPKVVDKKTKSQKKSSKEVNVDKLKDSFRKIGVSLTNCDDAVIASFTYNNLLLLDTYREYILKYHEKRGKKGGQLQDEKSAQIIAQSYDRLIKNGVFRSLLLISLNCSYLQITGFPANREKFVSAREILCETQMKLEESLDQIVKENGVHPPSSASSTEWKSYDCNETNTFVHYTLKTAEGKTLQQILPSHMRFTKTGKPRLDRQVLDHLKKHHKFIPLFLQWRLVKLRLAKFYDANDFSVLRNSDADTVVLKGHWNWTDSPSLRMSSTSPNLQCIPKQEGSMHVDGEDSERVAQAMNCRAVFSPAYTEEKMLLVSVDYSAVEFRILCRELEVGASTLPEISEADPFSKLLKNYASCLPYLKGDKAYTRNDLKTDIIKEMNRFVGDKEKIIPFLLKIGVDLREWRKRFDNPTTKPSYVMNLSNLQFVHSIGSSSKDREGARKKRNKRAMNGVLQASGAQLLNSAAAQFIRKIFSKRMEEEKWHHVKVLNFIHDELLFQCPASILDEVLNCVKYCMTESKSVRELMSWKKGDVYEHVPLHIGIEIGENWGEMCKEEKYRNRQTSHGQVAATTPV